MIRFASIVRGCTVLIPLLAVAFMVLMASPADSEMLDSAAFTYKYEGAALPDASDLDGNSTYDFGAGKSFNGVSGGILTLEALDKSGNNYLSDASGQAWDALGPPTLAEGYTIEARLKVISDEGTQGACVIHGRPSSSSGANYQSWLNIEKNGLAWGDKSSITLDSSSNTDGFHVFRLAQEGGGMCSVWRDGEPLGDSLSAATTSTTVRLFIGDADGDNKWKGEVQVDYVRFTKGAYAPAALAVPEPSVTILLAVGVLGLLVVRLRRRK